MRKAGGNWVVGDRFFDREAELEALSERVREGTHTLLTAQRRMGKTSLVRELLRRLDMEHYEGRLRLVLGDEASRVAFEMLTEAAVAGRLIDDAIARRRAPQASEATSVHIDQVLHVLEHDGYLARQDAGYSFTSGLLEDWWRVRYGRSAASSAFPSTEPAPSAER